MNKTDLIIAIAILVGLLLSFFSGVRYGTRKGLVVENPDTVVVEKWVHDTIVEPYETVKYATKYVYLPVHDTTEVHDMTVVRDSVMVEVPITEKSYASSNYNLTIRGFQPELVNIWVKQQEKTVTIPYRKKWCFTIGPQIGYGYTTAGWQPYAGAGLTFGYTF